MNASTFPYRLILSISLAVCGLLIGCDKPASKNGGESGQDSSAGGSRQPAGAATIKADPNPVPKSDGKGATTITWSTGDGKWGQVFVSVNGAPETLFAQGRSDSKSANWIGKGTYEFKLYAGKEHQKLLAEVKVTKE